MIGGATDREPAPYQIGSISSGGGGGSKKPAKSGRRNSIAMPGLGSRAKKQDMIEGAKASLAEHAKAEHAKVADQRERELVRQIFRAVDDDGDSFLNFQELSALALKTGGGSHVHRRINALWAFEYSYVCVAAPVHWLRRPRLTGRVPSHHRPSRCAVGR